jgi:hypothetical protein
MAPDFDFRVRIRTGAWSDTDAVRSLCGRPSGRSKIAQNSSSSRRSHTYNGCIGIGLGQDLPLLHCLRESVPRCCAKAAHTFETESPTPPLRQCDSERVRIRRKLLLAKKLVPWSLKWCQCPPPGAETRESGMHRRSSMCYAFRRPELRKPSISWALPEVQFIDDAPR